MNRRECLAALGLAPLVARSFYDMGAAWQKHDSGVWTLDDSVGLYLEYHPRPIDDRWVRDWLHRTTPGLIDIQGVWIR